MGIEISIAQCRKCVRFLVQRITAFAVSYEHTRTVQGRSNVDFPRSVLVISSGKNFNCKLNTRYFSFGVIIGVFHNSVLCGSRGCELN